jgi:hypothetical protein
MNESQQAEALLHNVSDARRNRAPDGFDSMDLALAFRAMGQTDDLWAHTNVPMSTIREILVQAHNYIVIG